MADLSFRFKEQVSPINYVSGLASGMHYYAPQDALRGPYVMSSYEEGMIEEVLASIVPDNALVMFSDKSAAADRVTRYYEVPYGRKAVAGGAIGRVERGGGRTLPASPGCQ